MQLLLDAGAEPTADVCHSFRVSIPWLVQQVGVPVCMEALRAILTAMRTLWMCESDAYIAATLREEHKDELCAFMKSAHQLFHEDFVHHHTIISAAVRSDAFLG